MFLIQEGKSDGIQMDSATEIRVLCFCEKWENGGIESFLCSLLTHGECSELAVDIVCTSINQDSIFYNTLRQKGINFYELSGRPYDYYRNTRLFQKLLAERRYDVVYLHLFHAVDLIYGKIACHHGVKRVIAHSHNSDLRKSRFSWIKRIAHNIAKHIYSKYLTSFFACSQIAAEFMFAPIELTEKGYIFVPNGIDIAKFRFDASSRQCIRSALGLQDSFVIGNIGRLCYQKNQIFLLDVLLALKKSCIDAVLLLVGDGADEQILREKVSLLGLGDSVVFYGVTTTPWELYSAMDVFALPSIFEGFGIVAVEARANGLPIICSEKIPQEAVIASKAKCISIQNGANAWAEEIEKIRRTDMQQREAGEDVLQFSANRTQELIFSVLLNKDVAGYT